MKRLFPLAVAALLFAACSSDDKENTSPGPAPVDTRSQDEVLSTSKPVTDTAGGIPQPALQDNAPTASTKTMKTESRPGTMATEIKTKAKVENAAGTMGYAPAVTDSNIYLVNKAREEALFRKKIHENNSIDGGGQ
ncbi:MAG: hypothetical protein JSS76_17945 [Bacteroidetes bacterium]|nr:hypothetical protein [Bacteroidota bacterium]